ncbi:Uncharacterised protein [Streptococcus pneumoniae]|nr:Uncharacterised protein [Streptococcus pneumoniae]
MFVRDQLINQYLDRLPISALAVMSAVPRLDAALFAARSSNAANADDANGSEVWGNNLRHHLDEIVAAVQSLRTGHDIAFLTQARMCFERWSTNRSFNLGVDRSSFERADFYYDAVWQGILHSLGSPGSAWSSVSENLHGRADMPYVSSCFADPVKGKIWSRIPAPELIDQACNLLLFALVQITNCIQAHCVARNVSLPPDLGSFLPKVHWDGDSDLLLSILEVFSYSIRPADPIVVNRVPRDFEFLADTYEEFISSPGAFDGVAESVGYAQALGAIVVRRSRTFRRAARQFQWERTELENSSFELLYSRLFRYGATSEFSQLVGLEVSGDQGVALRTAGLALSSATQLWLDDNDACVACLRTVLEQTGRAMLHRKKPDKALVAEERHLAPGRILEMAGLKRLGPVNRAMGEFNHYHRRSLRSDARDLLVEVNSHLDENPELTARGNLLQACAYLLADEVFETIRDSHPLVAAEFKSQVPLVGLNFDKRLIGSFLDRSLSARDFRWRDPSVFSADEVRLW